MPEALRPAAAMVRGNGFPMFLVWGVERRLFYNEAYAPILGDKHPQAFGRPDFEVWPEVEAVVGPIIARAYAGQSSYFEDLPVVLQRNGRAEGTYFTFSYSPVVGTDEAVLGALCVCMETTRHVQAEERGRFLYDLERRLRELDDPAAVVGAAQEMLGRRLGACRVGFGEVDESARYFTTENTWTDGTVPPLDGPHDLAAVGPEILDAVRRGERLVVDDVATDPRIPEGIRGAFHSVGVGAGVTETLIRGGRMRAAINVHAREPRRWTEAELSLITDVAERTWSALERARAEGAQRAAERQVARVLDTMGDAFILLDPQFRVVRINAQALGMEKRPASEFIGKHYWEAWPENRDEELYAALQRGFAEGRPVERVVGHVWPDGRRNWLEMRAYPSGEDLAVFYRDVTARKEDELTLAHERERLALALEAGDLGMWEFDLLTGQLEWDRLTRAHFGLGPDAPVTYERYMEAIHPEDRARAQAAFREAAEDPSQSRYASRNRVVWPDGTVRRLLGQARFLRDEQGRAVRVIGTTQDVTDESLAEERRKLLIDELNHRVKNNLANVQSLALQTSGGDSVDQFRAAFLSRLRALSRAHDLLTRNVWEAADLRDVVALTVEPYGERVEAEGPSLALTPNAALSLNLALHELATNAAKYGALSTSDGRVEVRWSTAEGRLLLAWTERGGPPVAPPERRGFGSRLLERGVAAELGGAVTLAFQPDGLRCRIEAPLERVRSGA